MRVETLLALKAHAERAAPHEACGVVVADAEGHETVLRWANVSPTPERAYAVAPADLARLIPLEAAGCRVVIVYHSHPDGNPTFSGEDQAGALCDGAPAYPDAIQIVVAVSNGRATGMRRYRWIPEERTFGPLWR